MPFSLRHRTPDGFFLLFNKPLTNPLHSKNRTVLYCGQFKEIGTTFGSCQNMSAARGGKYEEETDMNQRSTDPVNLPASRHSAEALPLPCILAYVPLLFWAPLAAGKDNPKYRHCANQGLWCTISCIACVIVLLAAPAVLLGEAGLIHALSAGWELLHWSSRLAYGVLALTALNTVLYGPLVCIKGICPGITSVIPYRLPIVGRLKLIR